MMKAATIDVFLTQTLNSYFLFLCLKCPIAAVMCLAGFPVA
jgi:hypothetical protein